MNAYLAKPIPYGLVYYSPAGALEMLSRAAGPDLQGFSVRGEVPAT
jgi:hypothetical protein